MTMRSTLSVLGGKGDTRLTWDPDDPDDCERMRATVATLKAAGYSFFLTDNRPADEFSPDPQGILIVRKLAAEEVVPDPPADEPALAAAGEAAPPRKRRGRPPKVRPEGRDVVAVRPVLGG